MSSDADPVSYLDREIVVSSIGQKLASALFIYAEDEMAEIHRVGRYRR
jgi:hypothetical protein